MGNQCGAFIEERSRSLDGVNNGFTDKDSAELTNPMEWAAFDVVDQSVDDQREN